jgi:hypothetical protein
LQLHVGRRHYGVLAPRVVRQFTWGVVGSYGRSEQRAGAFFVSAPIQYDIYNLSTTAAPRETPALT